LTILSSARAPAVIKRLAANAQANAGFIGIPPRRDRGSIHCAWFAFANKPAPRGGPVKLSTAFERLRYRGNGLDSFQSIW
jgi:hypothetical protein